MAKPVFLLVLGRGYTEAWYQLPKAEQDALWAQVLQVEQSVGAKWHIVCNSRWADEGIYHWGVIEYPDLDAFHRKVEQLEALNWWRYFSANTILGTKMEA